MPAVEARRGSAGGREETGNVWKTSFDTFGIEREKKG